MIDIFRKTSKDASLTTNSIKLYNLTEESMRPHLALVTATPSDIQFGDYLSLASTLLLPGWFLHFLICEGFYAFWIIGLCSVFFAVSLRVDSARDRVIYVHEPPSVALVGFSKKIHKMNVNLSLVSIEPVHQQSNIRYSSTLTLFFPQFFCIHA